MRSLEEWTKYLEQQEQAMERALKRDIDPEEPVTASPPRVSRVVEPATTVRTARARATAPAQRDIPKRNSVSQEKLPLSNSTIGASDEALVRTAARLRQRLPQHLTAPEDSQSEVAQSSYKRFKETREELLCRLLDPQLSLEDAARILNVCPTTVRRYTNKDLLKHVRTAGNQRRFKLSDVLSFLEAQALRQQGNIEA